MHHSNLSRIFRHGIVSTHMDQPRNPAGFFQEWKRNGENLGMIMYMYMMCYLYSCEYVSIKYIYVLDIYIYVVHIDVYWSLLKRKDPIEHS